MPYMTHVHTISDVARPQSGVLSHWQLVRAGWSRAKIAHATRGLRELHDGVWVTGDGPLTPVQRWWGATLTAPGTVLADFSAGACWEMRPWSTTLVSVVRKGTCGPRQYGRLRVRYSRTLRGDVVRQHGFLITSPERTVIDLWPHLAAKQAERLLREATRIGRTDTDRMIVALDRHRGRRGTASLAAIVAVYARLPLKRCKSDAEVEGLLVLDRAGIEIPVVNERFAGEEADFCWPDRMLIIEIDGGSFHQDPLEDARKTRVWILAGWTVHRIPSDDVYHAPERLIALAR
jgi:hypothetical protein